VAGVLHGDSLRAATRQDYVARLKLDVVLKQSMTEPGGGKGLPRMLRVDSAITSRAAVAI
jgi:hypothetical protein